MAHGEAAQLVAFFAALLFCAVLEIISPNNAARSRRGRRWPTNIGLTFVNLALLLLLPATVLSASVFAAGADWGLLNRVDLPLWITLVSGFALRSLMAYVVHRMMHKVPLFWRLHRIHHSDTQMDISTTIRVHPIEFAVTIPLHMLGVIVFGIPPIAIMFYEIIDAAQTVITHGNLRLPQWLDKGLRWLLVTPDMHRMHHSSRQPETDSNYGTTVALWDHLFRTYTMRDRDAQATMEIGLTESQDRRPDSLFWLLRLPFITLRPEPSGQAMPRSPA